MPTYEYYCFECKTTTEIKHSINDDSEFVCIKHPGYHPMQRLISAPMIIVKGKTIGPDIREEPEILWKSKT